MKKYLILLLLALIFLPKKVFSNNNFIYSLEVIKDSDSPVYELVLKSDYKAKIKSKSESDNSIYFDIKNASLKENFSAMYDNAQGIESVIAQQIGTKVRIYIKGDNTKNTKISFTTVEKQNLSDTSVNYVLIVSILSILALFAALEIKNKMKIKQQKMLAKSSLINKNTMYKLRVNNEIPNKNKKHGISQIAKGTGTIAQRYEANKIKAKFDTLPAINPKIAINQ